MDSAVWHKLWRWIRRRHPNKTAIWRRKKYCTRYKGNTWTFTDGKGLTLQNVASIPITRYVKIESGRRVYDSDEHTSKYFKQRATENSLSQVYSIKVEKLFKKQKGKCACCGRLIEEMGGTHVHHMRPRSEQGTDEPNNLKLLHQSCHEELHSVFTRNQMTQMMNLKFNYIKLCNVEYFRKNPKKLSDFLKIGKKVA